MATKVDSSGLSVIAEERNSARKHLGNGDDCESVYSNHKTKSVYYGQKKKLHPLMLGPSRQNPGKIISLHAASKNNLSEFTQRIMSAKLIRTKQVQNQLNETQNQLNELINENRILRNMLKRQEGALKKYEGNHAELPQLIRSHNEEIRALKVNNKLIKAQLRESNSKLKDRENELEALRDNYNKLKKLSTEKNLLEREKLQKKVEELQEIIKEQEEKIQVLSRKVLLESKNYRHHLNIEVMKHKETQKDLSSALSMISKLERELMTKDKQVTGGKALLKRENKNLMPAIVSKATDVQPKIGASEDNFLCRTEEKRHFIHDSPESELELLSCMESSDDTPSPIQDIFPEIMRSQKVSPEMKTTTEITFSKSEMFQINNELSARSHNTLKFRKNSSSKKNIQISNDPESNAKALVKTLNKDMETIKALEQKVQASTLSLENKDDVKSLFDELKISAPKPDMGNCLLSNAQENEEGNIKFEKQEKKRNVPKRKLEEKENDLSEEETTDFDLKSDLTKTQQQKLENMTKTWNNLRSKIQEERAKAEEKMKELQTMHSDYSFNDTYSDVENEKAINPDIGLKAEAAKELNFVNFADDAYILQELEKTDKVFNKLKNDTKKLSQKTPTPKSSSKDKNSKPDLLQKQKPPPEIKSFRTESQREPKYLEEFQQEYQKQNLLKALKAIDIGKDPNESTDESEDSNVKAKKEKPFQQKNGLRHIKQLTSDSDNGLMAELFGPRHKLDKTENLKLKLRTVANVNE